MKFKRFLPFIPLILVIVFIYLPSVFLPWSLIDDGNRLLVGEKMTQAAKVGNFTDYFSPPIDKPIGRFRPSYWIYHQVSLVFLGKNAFLHHSARIMLLFVFLITLYQIIARHANKKIAILSCLLLLIFPGTVENWWRLGPQEPLMMTFGALSLWFILIEKKLFPPLLFAFLFFTSKETSIFVLPVILYILLFDNKKLKKDSKVFLFVSGVFAAIVSFISFSLIQSSGYSSGTSFDVYFLFNNFLTNLKHFLHHGHKYILILTTTWIPFYLLGKGKEKRFFINTLLLFISSFAISLTWPHPLARYLFPSVVFLSIICAFFVSSIFKTKTVSPFGFFIKGIVFLSLISLFFYSLIFTLAFTTNYFAREKANRRYLEYLSQLPHESEVCVNLNKEADAREWFVETNKQLQVIYQSPLRIKYLSDCILNGKSNQYVFDWNIFRDLSSHKLSKLTTNYQKETISEEYLVPMGGIKTYMEILLKDPVSLVKMKKGFQKKYWFWDIYQKEVK